MTSPAITRPDHGAASVLHAPFVPSVRAEAAPHCTPSLTRRYEAAALRPDLTVARVTVTAPALPLFETATAAFARGTLVQTPLGPVAVEDLGPGDIVDTTTGPEPVVWVGSTTFVPGDESDEAPSRASHASSRTRSPPAGRAATSSSDPAPEWWSRTLASGP